MPQTWSTGPPHLKPRRSAHALDNSPDGRRCRGGEHQMSRSPTPRDLSRRVPGQLRTMREPRSHTTAVATPTA